MATSENKTPSKTLTPEVDMSNKDNPTFKLNGKQSEALGERTQLENTYSIQTNATGQVKAVLQQDIKDTYSQASTNQSFKAEANVDKSNASIDVTRTQASNTNAENGNQTSSSTTLSGNITHNLETHKTTNLTAGIETAKNVKRETNKESTEHSETLKVNGSLTPETATITASTTQSNSTTTKNGNQNSSSTTLSGNITHNLKTHETNLTAGIETTQGVKRSTEHGSTERNETLKVNGTLTPETTTISASQTESNSTTTTDGNQTSSSTTLSSNLSKNKTTQELRREMELQTSTTNKIVTDGTTTETTEGYKLNGKSDESNTSITLDHHKKTSETRGTTQTTEEKKQSIQLTRDQAAKQLNSQITVENIATRKDADETSTDTHSLTTKLQNVANPQIKIDYSLTNSTETKDKTNTSTIKLGAEEYTQGKYSLTGQYNHSVQQKNANGITTTNSHTITAGAKAGRLNGAYAAEFSQTGERGTQSQSFGLKVDEHGNPSFDAKASSSIDGTKVAASINGANHKLGGGLDLTLPVNYGGKLTASISAETGRSPNRSITYQTPVGSNSCLYASVGRNDNVTAAQIGIRIPLGPTNTPRSKACDGFSDQLKESLTPKPNKPSTPFQNTSQFDAPRPLPTTITKPEKTEIPAHLTAEALAKQIAASRAAGSEPSNKDSSTTPQKATESKATEAKPQETPAEKSGLKDATTTANMPAKTVSNHMDLWGEILKKPEFQAGAQSKNLSR